MSSSSENKDFRQLENYFNIILDSSSSEDKVMNIRSKLGIILYFCCIKDPMKTLNYIVEKMVLYHAAPGISIILFSCACYIFQFIPNINDSENYSKITTWIEAPLLRHAVFDDSSNMYNISRFLQAGGAKMMPCPDVFLCELLLRHENIGTSITAKPIALLIDLNPEANSSIFWRLFSPEQGNLDEIFSKNEPFMILISKIVSCSKLLPPTDENKLSILLKLCEYNCQIANKEAKYESSQKNETEETIKKSKNERIEEKNQENDNHLNKEKQNNEQDKNDESTDDPKKSIQSSNTNENDNKTDETGKKQIKFHYIEISLTILRWLISHNLYDPLFLKPYYGNISLDCLVVECWCEYAKYGDLSKLPKFDRNDPSMQSIYIRIIKNALSNPNFSFDSISVNHWLWDSILNEFSFHKSVNEKNLKNRTLYNLSSNELMNCSGIANILPEWFFIHCFRFKCRSSEISIRLLSIVSDLPASILINNFEDFVDFIMYHLTSFPQNTQLIANCVRDLITFLLPRMNPLIDRIVTSIDYFDEANLSPRLLLLNNIFCFGVEADSFADVFDNLIESIPLLEGSISLSLCTSMFNFFSLMTFYVKKNDDIWNILFNIAMAVIYSTVSSCASHLSTVENVNNISGSSSTPQAGGSNKNMQIRRTMSQASIKVNLNNNSQSNTNEWSMPLRAVTTPRSNQSQLSSSSSSSLFLNKSINLVNNENCSINLGNNDSILLSNKDGANDLSTPHSINTGTFNVQPILDFTQIDEPSFISKCEQSHSIYTACCRFYSVTSSDIINKPTYKPSDSFPLTPLALHLIEKLPASLFGKDLEGLSNLIDYLPSLLPLFPTETISLSNFLIEAGSFNSYPKQLSLLCGQLNQHLSHDDSFGFVLQVMKFVQLLAKVSPQESIALKPVNVKTLGGDIDETRQALQADPEIIPLIVMKGKHLSLLLELTAPKIDESLLVALSVKLQQSKSGHELRQIRSLLSHFNFKQPCGFSYDSWLKRDFGTEESDSENHIIRNQISKEKLNQILLKNDDDLIFSFSKFYPVDFKLKNVIELIISITKSYKFCPELSTFICSIISAHVNDCVQFGKNKFWFIKFLFLNGVKFEFPQDTENEKCIEFALRNGFLPRNLIDSQLEKDKKNVSNEEEETDQIEEWMYFDRLYLLLPSEIEEIWSNHLVNKGRILCSKFLPNQAIVPKDFLLKLIVQSSSLPSIISNSNLTQNSSSSLTSSSSNSSTVVPFFSTLPCCVCQHILEYLLVFASSSPDEAGQFFASNDNAIVGFLSRVDIHNHLVFESLFTFVSSLILMFGASKKNYFVLKFAEVFLKMVFCIEDGIFSACSYEVLPMLKKILDVFQTFGKKFKANESLIQFLSSLKKGLPSVREYIPDSLVE